MPTQPTHPVIAGALVLAAVVAATVFADSDPRTHEDEAVVLAAISQIESAEENCDISYGLNTDELDIFQMVDSGYGVTFGLPHADDTITTVVIECVVSEDVDAPDWDKWGMWYDLDLRYPIKRGSHAKAINDHVRRDVADMVSEYYAKTRDRIRSHECCPDLLEGLQERAFRRSGDLNITGFVSLMNDGLYSVSLNSSAHDPESNTSENYLRTLNYDLATGEEFLLNDVLSPGHDSYERLLRLALAASSKADWTWSDEFWSNLDSDDLRDQDFTLTANGIALHCTWYCNKGIAPILLFKGNGLEIPYRDLDGYLDPNGPFRHIDVIERPGDRPTVPPSTTACEDTYTASKHQRPNEAVGVFVANGTSATMRATEVSQILSAEGFRWITTLWNAVPVPETKIYYAMGYAAEARGIQATLFPCMVELLPPAPPGTDWIPRAIDGGDPVAIRLVDRNVVVILGSDTSKH